MKKMAGKSIKQLLVAVLLRPALRTGLATGQSGPRRPGLTVHSQLFSGNLINCKFCLGVCTS